MLLFGQKGEEIIKQIFLDDLPKCHKDHIDWVHSVGYIVKFIYNNISGTIKINSYNKNKHLLFVEYKNENYNITTNDFRACQLGVILNVKGCSSKYKYNVSDIINGDILILEQIREKPYGKGYKCKCLKDNYIWNIGEYQLLKGYGCPVCSNHKVMIGVNDMWTTAPEQAKLLANPDDGYKYTQCSDKRLDWKCPQCGYIIKNKSIGTIHRNGLSCPKCSDGFSYPNKFIFNMLQQLGLDFECEKSFTWSDKRRYDAYITNYNCIIEMHGVQHYKEDFKLYGSRSLQEEQENDNYKEQLAKENGITNDHYIAIDCRKSEMEWIKNNILKSNLTKIFDLSNVDWDECNKYACKNLVFKIAEIYNNIDKHIDVISNICKLSKMIVRKYLKQSAELKLTDFTIEKSKQLRNQNLHIAHCSKVICITTNEVFDSITQASQKYKTDVNNISACCMHKPHKKSSGKLQDGTPLTWMYLTEYINIKFNKEKVNKKCG